jgi:hypothetical protein
MSRIEVLMLPTALSTYCVLSCSSGKKVYPPIGIGLSCCCSSRDLVPHLKPLSHDLAIGGGREPVADASLAVYQEAAADEPF